MTVAILREIGPGSFAVTATRDHVENGEIFTQMPKVAAQAPLIGSLLNRSRWDAPARYKVSVILVHYNDQKALRLCLAQYAGQVIEPRSMEIIVADDGTPGGIEDTIKECRWPNIRVITNPRKDPKEWRNPAQVSNAALAACEGENYILHGAHVVPSSPTAVSNMIALQRGKFGRVLSSTVDLDRTSSTEVFRAPASIRVLASRGIRFYRYVALTPLDAALRVGGFSQCWKGWGGEDIDLEDRMARSGLRDLARYEMGRWVHLWHPPLRESLGEQSARRLRWWMAQKHTHAVHDPVPKLYTL